MSFTNIVYNHLLNWGIFLFLCFSFYSFAPFLAEYLELEQILTPETDATLRKLLRNPIKKVRTKGNNGRSMRKFRVISGQIVRPGYSSESQFACRHCGKRYRWKSTLRRHEQVECGGKEPMFQCPQCPYRAKQKGNLGVHIRKHHSELLSGQEDPVSSARLQVPSASTASHN